MWLARDLSQVLRSKKLPRNYQVVHDVVAALDVGQHAAAGEIHQAARAVQPGIGYSTIYRALSRLTQLGLVLEVSVPGHSSALYEPARANHAHFCCEACGRIADIDYTMPVSEVASVARGNGVAVADVSVTFRGTCGRCRSKAAASLSNHSAG